MRGKYLYSSYINRKIYIFPSSSCYLFNINLIYLFGRWRHKEEIQKTSPWFSMCCSKGAPLLWDSPPHPWNSSALSLNLSFAVDFSLGQGHSPSFTGIPDTAFFQLLAVIKVEHSIFLVNGKLKPILKTNFRISVVLGQHYGLGEFMVSECQFYFFQGFSVLLNTG